MMRIAVVGSGISGLAAAYYLSRRHEVWVFERDERIGGHTHTVEVDSPNGPLAVDTGFIVHNDRTYPNLVRLFAELGVETQASDMSFAVRDRVTGYEYSSRGLRGFFAQKRNWFRPAQYRLLREIMRFNREAAKVLDEPSSEAMTLGELLDCGGYSAELKELYLYPMASAVWSMSTDAIGNFPAVTLVRFFQNHGMLRINTHPQWKVLRGGSRRYLAPLTRPYAARIETSAQIASIVRNEHSVKLHFTGRERPPLLFDHVVFACHGNQVLPMLAQPSDMEREVMGTFRTSRNEVLLHTDEGLLARRHAARASWNYNLRENGAAGTTVTYLMNRLQKLPGDVAYCVTLNGGEQIQPENVLRRFVYHHPVYDRATIAAQNQWSEISGRNRTHYCGAYWFYGFHEDGLNSAMRVARALGVSL